MKKVEAWQTDSGQLFINKKDAKAYEDGTNKNIIREKTLEDNKDFIIDYHIKQMKKWDPDYVGYKNKIHGPSCEGEFGWDCDHEDNPIEVCVYLYDEEFGDDESCVFCGQPEERK